MARPLKSGLDYFPHDVDASHDEKIEALESIYGLKGYAIYFKLLERIYRAGGFLLIPDAEMIQILGRNLSVTEQELKNILEFCCRHGLFDKETWETEGLLTSGGIQKRAKTVLDKRKKEQEKYAGGQKKFGEDQTYMRHKKAVFERDGYKCLNCGNENKEQLTIDHIIPKSKGGTDDIDNLQTLCLVCNIKKRDSIIVKKPEVIKKAYGQFKNVHLTDIELAKLTDSFPDINNKIEALSEYKKSHGKAYKDDYATILSWHRKDLKEHPPVAVSASNPAHRKFEDV